MSLLRTSAENASSWGRLLYNELHHHLETLDAIKLVPSEDTRGVRNAMQCQLPNQLHQLIKHPPCVSSELDPYQTFTRVLACLHKRDMIEKYN